MKMTKRGTNSYRVGFYVGRVVKITAILLFVGFVVARLIKGR